MTHRITLALEYHLVFMVDAPFNRRQRAYTQRSAIVTRSPRRGTDDVEMLVFRCSLAETKTKEKSSDRWRIKAECSVYVFQHAICSPHMEFSRIYLAPL